MEENKYKYLVDVPCFLEITELSVDTGRCYEDPLNAYVEFPEVDEAERETLVDMLVNDDTLFTIPGYEELFDLKSVCREEDTPYWIRLQSIGNSIKDAVGLKEITSWKEYYELHAKITAKHNDDGSVTFSVPTLQGLRIREDAVPVFVSHADGLVKKAMPKYVINIKTLFGQFSDTGSFDGLIYECKLNDKTNEALSLLYKNKDSVLLVVSGYAPVYRAVRADLDSEEKKIKVYMSIYACYNNVRKDVTWLHSLEDLKAIGDESKVPWNAGMLTYKVEDAMPKKKGQLPVVVDLHKELDVVDFFQNENGDCVVEVKCNDKMKAFHRKYAGCKPIFELHTLEYKKYLTIKCEGDVLIDTAFWTLEELNPFRCKDDKPKGELPKNTLSEAVAEICSGLGLSVKSPLEREKELISKLQTGMLTYTDVAADGSKDGNAFTLCRCGRGNGKPIFDPSSPEHRSLIMSQALREMMVPIEDKFPQLHRARLNKPKSI